MLLNNWLPLLKAGNYSFASNKLQSTLQAVLTLVIYPFIFVSSIECTNSSILTGKNTYCTTFKIMWFKPVVLISVNGSGFLSQVKSNLFKYQSTMSSLHAFSRCTLNVSRFKPLTDLFFIFDTRVSARWNYCMMIGLQEFHLWQWFWISTHISTFKY